MKNCRLFDRGFWAVLMSFVVAWQVGCATTGSNSGTAGPAATNEGEIRTTDTTYHPGDKIVIDFADNPGIPSTWQQVVREDGSITLPQNQTITAAGKQKGE